MTFKMDPNAERHIQRMVVRNLTPKIPGCVSQGDLPRTRPHPTIEAKGDTWDIRGCCDQATTLGTEAIGKVNGR